MTLVHFFQHVLEDRVDHGACRESLANAALTDRAILARACRAGRLAGFTCGDHAGQNHLLTLFAKQAVNRTPVGYARR